MRSRRRRSRAIDQRFKDDNIRPRSWRRQGEQDRHEGEPDQDRAPPAEVHVEVHYEMTADILGYKYVMKCDPSYTPRGSISGRRPPVHHREIGRTLSIPVTTSASTKRIPSLLRAGAPRRHRRYTRRTWRRSASSARLPRPSAGELKARTPDEAAGGRGAADKLRKPCWPSISGPEAGGALAGLSNAGGQEEKNRKKWFR